MADSFGTHNAAYVLRLAKDLQRLVDKLNAIAESMAEYGFEEIQFTNEDGKDRAMTALANFGESGTASVRELLKTGPKRVSIGKKKKVNTK